MHIYDKDLNFQVRRAGDSNLTRWVSVTVARAVTVCQGGWALVSEQLPYAAGAARSILLDR
jgi:hypothetical protein